ncbi:MAG: hypothetical protein NT154_14115 [Verrucomicrobia bacterium]|nr:hypothetical protein [Verrucomicrobiota bacterium]
MEDDLSEAVVRRLLNHVRRGFQVRARYPLASLPHLRPELSGFGYLMASVQAFNHAAAETPHLLLTDLDVAICAPELIRKWLGGAVHPNFVLRVAVREVEAWLLADGKSMADFLGLALNDLPTNIEGVAEPKEEIVRLASTSPDPEIRDNLAPRPGSTATTGRLFTRSLIGYVRDLWDVNAAAGNADSLARALRALNSFNAT